MLRLKKNGILLKTPSSHDDKEPVDVSDVAFYHLNDLVELDDDIVLRDLFLLIEKNIDMFDLIFRNWLKEHVLAGLYGFKDEESHALHVNDKLEHVELRWELSHDNENFDIPSIPTFDGYSVAVETDEYYEKGQVIHWGLDFTPVQNYIDCPFKINNTILIYNEKTKDKKEYNTNDFTLYQIILGVIWEISFLGSPLDREQKRQEVDEQIEGIKNGEIEVFPLEDILGVLKEKIDDDEEL